MATDTPTSVYTHLPGRSGKGKKGGYLFMKNHQSHQRFVNP